MPRAGSAIRPYRTADLEDVLRVWLDASRIAHPFLSAEFLVAERETIRNVHLPSAESLVWVEAGQVRGFISLLGNQVGGLFVSPEHQGRGIGTRLVDAARARHGALEVEVFKENAIGRAFYAKYGFAELGEYLDEATGRPVLQLRCSAS